MYSYGIDIRYLSTSYVSSLGSIYLVLGHLELHVIEISIQPMLYNIHLKISENHKRYFMELLNIFSQESHEWFWSSEADVIDTKVTILWQHERGRMLFLSWLLLEWCIWYFQPTSTRIILTNDCKLHNIISPFLSVK